MKKKLTFIIIMLVSIIIPIKVNAEEFGITNDIVLQALLSTGGELRLDADITLNSDVDINNDTTLNLNGHTLDMKNKKITSYADFVVVDKTDDKNGKIKSTAQFIIQVGNSLNDGSFTLKSGTIEANGNYGIRNYGTLTIDGGTVIGKRYIVYNQKTFVMNGGELHATTGIALQNYLNSTFEMNGGKIITDADYQAINLYGSCKATINDGEILAPKDDSSGYSGNGITMFKDTELIVNGGKIISYGNAIMGNGSGAEGGSSDGRNAKITINGGTITATNIGVGIYAPQQQGVTTINGGTISGETGIEIRAGKLIVTGGTIIGSSDTYEVIDNSNGVTTKGASISVAQHTTKQPIEVIISSGEFNSSVPVSYTNPLDNPQEAIDKISLSITDGTFNATTDKTVVAVGDSKFISGGTYTTPVTEYVVDNYGERPNQDTSVTVLPYRKSETSDDLNPSIVDTNSHFPGDEVVISVEEKEDYEFDEIIIVDANGNPVEVTDNKFIMPDIDVTITIKYKYIYRITSGEDQTFEDKDIVITTNGDLSKLEDIYVNDEVLDTSNYTLDSGSTILTLSKDYLNSLSSGVYDIKFKYSDGEVSTTFKIQEKVTPPSDDEEKSDNPKTLDKINYYITILGLSIIGYTLIGVYIKKKLN